MTPEMGPRRTISTEPDGYEPAWLLYLPRALDYHAPEPWQRSHRGQADKAVEHKKPRKHPLAKVAFSRTFGLAFELPFVLVAWVVLGGGTGYLLDRWLHTAPVMMLIFGALGFAGGVWDVLRRLGGTDSKRKGSNGG
jgi:F0F1-type ATP synthase assembly protein I